jgi:hypothetical protein
MSAESDIDISLLEYNLSLTYEERLEKHQYAFELLIEILKAREELYGESKPPRDARKTKPRRKR